MEFQDQINSFMGKGNFSWFVGVVEDTADPMTLGRVKVRCFGFHTQDRGAIPTTALPWATVVQPTTSASTSGIGWSPNGLEADSWVIGFFADGEEAQYPIVIGTLPRVHRGAATNDPYAGSGSGYLTDGPVMGGDVAPAPFHGQDSKSYGPDIGDPRGPNPTNPPTNNITGLPPTSGAGQGAVIKDDGSYLTNKDIPNWPLKYYTWDPVGGSGGCGGGKGIACCSRSEGNPVYTHKATALALEALTAEVKGSAFTINSAYRTAKYNAMVGGAKRSMHMQGKAFDIALGSIGPIEKFVAAAVKHGFVGFGLYNSFIHIDTGVGRVWNNATQRLVPTMKAAGWYPGKPGLSGIKTTPGQTEEDTSAPVIEPASASPAVQDTGAGTGTGTGQQSSTAAGSSGEDSIVRTILAEAKGEGSAGMQGVANVIKNRGVKAGITPESVVSETSSKGVKQFTGYGDANYQSADPNSAIYKQAQQIWRGVNNGSLPDNTGNADHYHADYVDPSWNKSSEMQKTAVIGRHIFYNAHGRFVSTNGTKVGFQDPTGSLPYGEFKGQPTTHPSARGLNSYPGQSRQARDSIGSQTAFPVAGDKGTFGTPEEAAAPQYPYNRTYHSKTGHALEFDDTPGAGRVAIRHASGTRQVMTENGTRVDHITGNAYKAVGNDSYNSVNGNYYLSVQDDINMRATSDMVIHADGALITISRNDSSETVSGKKDIAVGEVFQVKANKIIFEAAQIDFYSTGNMNFMAEGDMNLKATGKMKMMGATTHIKGSTVYMDDVVRAVEGATEEAADAASADIGAAPSRSEIQKTQKPAANPDSHVTQGEAMEHYGGQQ